MSSPRSLAARIVGRLSLLTLSLSLSLAVAAAACGSDPPPRPPRSAATAGAAESPPPPRGHTTASGGSPSSLGDSALEPAAEAAVEAEDWAQAEALYREMGRRRPSNARAKRGLGLALYKQERYDEATVALTASLQLADDGKT